MTQRPTLSGSKPNGHPIADEFLLDYAAGTAPEPIAVLVAAHVALNQASRAALGQLEAAGGALLEQVPPVDVRADALDRALAQLGPQETKPRPAPRLTSDQDLPAALRPYVPHGLPALRWRGLSGFAVATLPCSEQTPYRLRLLRVAAGRAFPPHGHTGLEMLLVLKGGFSDEHGHYVRGDVCLSDEDVEHRPVADPDGECLCLAVTRGPVRFKGILGFLLAPFMRH
jgi:putative transcriptional regulator